MFAKDDGPCDPGGLLPRVRHHGDGNAVGGEDTKESEPRRCPPHHAAHRARLLPPPTVAEGLQYLLSSGVCAERERKALERDMIAFKRFAPSTGDNSNSIN